jgi:hypothetical protein
MLKSMMMQTKIFLLIFPKTGRIKQIMLQNKLKIFYMMKNLMVSLMLLVVGLAVMLARLVSVKNTA